MHVHEGPAAKHCAICEIPEPTAQDRRQWQPAAFGDHALEIVEGDGCRSLTGTGAGAKEHLAVMRLRLVPRAAARHGAEARLGGGVLFSIH